MRTSLALLLLVAGNTVHPLQAGEKKSNPAIQANNDFACDLYQALSAAQGGKNLFFSPYSISSALAMTLEGARNETAAEMGKVLRLPQSLRDEGAKDLPWKTADYHLGFNDLNRRLNEKPDDIKVQTVRQKLSELRLQLKTINQRIEAATKARKFQEVFPLQTESGKLAKQINALAQQVDQYELRIANAVWAEKTYPFDEKYFNSISKFYGSDALRNADFLNDFPGERGRINGWVEKLTNDRIKDLVPDFPRDVAERVKMILVNAIYFKGQWSTPFDAKQTKKEDFFLAGGDKTSALLMHLHHKEARYAAFEGDGSYFATPAQVPFQGGDKVKKYPERDGFLMLEVPVKGDKISMVVLAPQSPDGLADLEKRLSGENLTAWLAKLQKRPVQVALPRFKMDTDYKLGDVLKKMGMALAFAERKADFTGMSKSRSPDDNLSIHEVLHKAFVEVNEEGAEAAAATAVIMVTPTSAPAAAPFTPTFRADRPFIFLLRDTQSGAILFLGRLMQPGA